MRQAFTPRMVAGLEERIVAIVDGLVAAANAKGAFDGVTDLGEPMPVAVIADLIGVPAGDRARFRAWSAAIMSGEGRDAATLEFAAYIDELAARRRAAPEDDLISGLVALERDDLVAMIQLLLIAGQETAVYVIVNGIRALLTHPEQWEALRVDPGLAAAAVEEILRFDGPVEIAPPRYALEPVRLGGGHDPGVRARRALAARRQPRPGRLRRPRRLRYPACRRRPPSRVRARHPLLPRRRARPARGADHVRGAGRAAALACGWRSRHRTAVGSLRTMVYCRSNVSAHSFVKCRIEPP